MAVSPAKKQKAAANGNGVVYPSLLAKLEATGWHLNAAAKPYQLTEADKAKLTRAFQLDASDMVKYQKALVCLSADETVASGVMRLHENHVSSAPVEALSADVNVTHPEKTILGLFQYEDAVNIIITAYAKGLDVAERSLSRKVASDFALYRAFNVDNKLYQYPGHGTILNALPALLDHHRVVVVPSGQGIVEKPLIEALGMISQWDIVKFLGSMELEVLCKTIYQLNSSCGSAEEHLGAFVRQPICMSTDHTVAMAFAFMIKEKLHSVPVLRVQQEGHPPCEFVGHLSATDIFRVVHAGQDMGHILEMKLHHFILMKTQPLHYVTERHTLADAVNMMVNTRVHQVWVCNSKKQIVGIITCADIIRFFSRRLN
jgi:CBS domain-containing protein